MTVTAKPQNVTVFGAGYLGVTHAASMAEIGHNVLVIDVDEQKLAKLADGEMPFYEPGLEDLLRKHLASGRLNFSTSYAEAAAWGSVHFLGVGTPQKPGEYAADLQYVDAVIKTLSPLLTDPAVIFGKSTVPVGTSARLGRIAKALAPAGDAIEVAWNPEFLREGFAVHDTLHPDRIVVGVASKTDGPAERVLREIYAPILAEDVPFIVTGLETAELVKVSANAFLATKISFVNSMADVCEAAGADVRVLADAIGYDERIGRKFLNAGIGFGGGCLPKDIRAFHARAAELGVDLALLREVDSINLKRRERTVEKVLQMLGGSFAGAKVAVLGTAFKPDSDDVRDSPALNIAGQIQLRGAHVTAYDPKAVDNSRKLFPTLSYVASVEDAVRGADVVLVLTEWSEFRTIDPVVLEPLVRSANVIDGRNCLDPSTWRAAGFEYVGIGVS